MISPVGYGNFLHQDDGRVHHVADAVAAALRPCFPRSNVNRATLLQKLTMHTKVFRATRFLVEVAQVIATAALSTETCVSPRASALGGRAAHTARFFLSSGCMSIGVQPLSPMSCQCPSLRVPSAEGRLSMS